MRHDVQKIAGDVMIEVTKLNGVKTLINAELIETVEETPDTVISFVTGKKIIVKESRQEIKNLVILYKKECMSPCLVATGGKKRTVGWGSPGIGLLIYEFQDERTGG